MHHDHNCGHCHDHHHDHCHEHCHCGHSPLAELTALMKYMVSHNASHARELAELAARLRDAGKMDAYEQVLKAVSDFEKGNLRLSAVLSALDGEE